MKRAYSVGVGAFTLAVCGAGYLMVDTAPVSAWLTGPLVTPGWALSIAAFTFAAAAVLDHDV